LFSKLKNYLLKKNPIIFVDSQSKLTKTLNELSLEKIIGIDTEFDWRNTYYPNLSLIQISTRKKIFLLDCLKLSSLSILKTIFEDKDIVKVFHAARSDATVIFCSASLNISNCFDVQVAEKFLSKEDPKSYAKIVLKYLSLEIDKSETNSNWMKRPFTKNQISYAANDVRFLIKIYNKQKKILKKKNAFLTVMKLTEREVSLGSQKLYIPRLRKFKFQKKIEKNLFMWRENMAIERNVPPSYIFKDKYFKKILKVYDEDISKDIIYEILKNEQLANDLIGSLK
tara:strand:+ start:64 stop:912 length:849 start_codon:yes stop_codon:yes gene_type:complete